MTTGHPRRGRRLRDRALAARQVLGLGVVFGMVTLGLAATGTQAAWVDASTVTGTTVATGTLAPPTGVSVSQTCVPDPSPVRQSGTTLTTNASNSGSVTIARPAGAVAGDLLLAAVTWTGDWTTATPSAPGGWTLIRATGDNALGQFLYYRLMTAGDPASWTWTGPASNATGGMLAYSGIDASNPVNTSSGAPDTVSGQATAPSVTTTRGNVVLVAFFGVLNGNLQTPPASMNAVWNGASLTAPAISTLAAQQSWPAIGTTGSRIATGNGTRSVSQMVALQPYVYPYATVTWTPSTTSYATGQDYRRTVSAVLQRQASLGVAATSEYDGPLSTGTNYTVTLRATYNNWSSEGAAASFTGLTC